MTFLHKLARRLARLKAGTVVAVAVVPAAAAFVGCELRISEPLPLPTVSRLVVSPKTVTLTPDESRDFMAVGFTSTGDTAPTDVTWSASGGSVAQRATHGGRHYGQYKNGLCGNYTVTATAHPSDQSDAASVTVACTATPASVVVSPPTASLLAGQTMQLTGTALDTSGNVLSGWTMSWSSSNAAVAAVTNSGLVAGVTAGSATITATSEGQSGTSAITVAAAPAPPAGSCLTWAGVTITLSGLSTSPYQNTGLASGTKLDATTAQWILNTPDVWGYMGGGSNLCWHGGQILGTIPPSTPYEDNLNGYHLMYGVDVHGASAMVEGLTIFTGGDGITFDASEDANWTVRDVHMTYIRDDCIENDFLNSGLVDRSFFDGCYDFMSSRAYGSNSPDGTANTVTVQNSLVRVQAMDAIYPVLTPPGYGGFWKWSGSGSPNTGNGPSLVITNTVFRADALPSEDNGAGLYMAPPPPKLKSCSNNVMVWEGPGSFPEPLPSCFTVLTGQAGIDYWNNAVAQWKAAHPAPVDVAPPIVSLWSPGLSGASTLTGTVSLVATAVDDQALTAVQFALDGQPIGAPVTSGALVKYTLSWDSHAAANGNYTLTAIATDAAGHRTTSAGVGVTVRN